MEDNSWTWSEQEDLRLDAQFPLVSHSLWDDLVDNEDVVRSLFPPSPLSAGGADIFDTAALASEEPDSLDGNLEAPFKRRRIVGFDEEDSSMDMSYCLAEPIMSCTDFLVGVCENLQLVESSVNSTMCLTNEESISSSVDDAAEQSSENWKVGTPASDDSDTGDAREIAGHSLNPPVCAAVPHKAFLPKANRVSIVRPGLTTTSTPAMVPRFSSRPSRSNLRMQMPGKGVVMKNAAQQKGRQAHPAKKCSSQVLAYPFALVKPIGLQGDVTLQDINERINMVPCKAKTGSEQHMTALSSPLSGKSVVALTKIHTEGKGTITIMRTKS